MMARLDMKRGRSSGVEHNLAKVGVEGSNPFARSSKTAKKFDLQKHLQEIRSKKGLSVNYS